MGIRKVTKTYYEVTCDECGEELPAQPEDNADIAIEIKRAGWRIIISSAPVPDKIKCAACREKDRPASIDPY